jgi:predicted SAM-dependent methyltransferase
MQCYATGSVDMFLCSHVLEHVPNDRQAVRELFRILRPGGWGILMVPLHVALTETYENPAITSDAERWKHFGQNDHLRVYAKPDFFAKVKEAGFALDALDESVFGAEAFRRHGIHTRSVLYIVKK